MYVIKRGDKYLRYGSYNTATEVDRPEQGTLYSRLKDAQYRLSESRKDLWISRTHVTNDGLSVVKVEFTSTEEAVL